MFALGNIITYNYASTLTGGYNAYSKALYAPYWGAHDEPS